MELESKIGLQQELQQGFDKVLALTNNSKQLIIFIEVTEELVKTGSLVFSGFFANVPESYIHTNETYFPCFVSIKYFKMLLLFVIYKGA